MLGLICIQTVRHSDGTPERFFFKLLILKNISRRQKACKELILHNNNLPRVLDSVPTISHTLVQHLLVYAEEMQNKL